MLNHTMKNKGLQTRLDGATRRYGEGEIPPPNHPVMSDLVIVAREPTVSNGQMPHGVIQSCAFVSHQIIR